jgi:hypothetical protein
VTSDDAPEPSLATGRQRRLGGFDSVDATDPEQLALAEFDETLADLPPIADPSVSVDESVLDRAAETLADLETAVDGEPLTSAEEWAATDPEAKAATLSVRLRSLCSSVRDRFADEDSGGDAPTKWYR